MVEFEKSSAGPADNAGSPPPVHRTRAQPPRPDVTVQPLRPRDEASPSIDGRWRLAAALWSSAGVVYAALAVATAISWDTVVSGVESAVSAQDATADHAAVSDTATATLLSSGAAAGVLLLLAAVSLNLLRGETTSAKFLLIAVGILTVAASVTFSTFVSEVSGSVGFVLRWGPLAAAAAAASAVVTILVRRR